MAGLSAPGIVGGVFRGASTLSVVPSETTLFRAVSKAELDDIVNFGLRPDPTGRGYQGTKLFAQTADDAVQFGRSNYKLDNIPNFIIKADVPNNILRGSYRFSDVGRPAISISSENLNLLQNVRPFNYSPYIRTP